MKPLGNMAPLASVPAEGNFGTSAEGSSGVAGIENNRADRAYPHRRKNHLLRHHRMDSPSARRTWVSALALPTRRLATLLCADAVGYSRLMQDDDHRTLETLKRHRTCISRICVLHNGRVVNMPGDSILVEFCSAVDALHAAIEIQRSMESSNDQLESPRRMHFRIGLDLGDILVDSDGSVYGTGVNIAARMQGLAGRGGIVMSGKVFDEVSAGTEHRFRALGRRRVKNIRDRVRAYEVRSAGCATIARSNVVQNLAAVLRGVLIVAADHLFPPASPLHGPDALWSSTE